jgi:hypothetical protein
MSSPRRSTPKGATAYLKWCSFCARRFVHFHWHAIELFAKRLIEAGVLGWEKLRDALVEAWLPPGTTMEERRNFQSSMAALAKKFAAGKAAARKLAAAKTRPTSKRS